jgi:aromatic ring-opening dioxygenase catalytic subunit (LigB family)
MPSSRLPTYYLSHGGGPWPWMKAETGGRYDKLEAALVAIRAELGRRPKAVLMISGHWEAHSFTVSTSPRPPMLYDYYGFPEHTYRIQYGAPGSPELAERVRGMLEAGGLEAASDPARGFDHGTFSLMAPLYPEADMPVVQLSMQEAFDPEVHLEAGRLLAPLREDGVVIIGSGSSYHNLRHWNASAAVPSRQFDDWLNETLVDASPAERKVRLGRWSEAPAARIAHPREEHLIPLMVAAGAAGDDRGARIYHEDAFRDAIALSSFRFGAS